MHIKHKALGTGIYYCFKNCFAKFLEVILERMFVKFLDRVFLRKDKKVDGSRVIGRYWWYW